MTITRTSHAGRRVIVASALATLLIAVAPATASKPPSPLAVNGPNAPARVAVACTTSAERLGACRVVTRFFQGAANGRFAASCALLGDRLRQETGGPSCPHAIAFASPHSYPWVIAGIRRTASGLGVLVRLGVGELDRVRMRTWLAGVGLEHGQRRILWTRIVD